MKRNIPKTAQHKCCPKYTYTYIPKIHSHRRDPKQSLWQTLTPPAPRAHGPHREADKCTQICLILVTFPYGVTSLMLYSFDCCAYALCAALLTCSCGFTSLFLYSFDCCAYALCASLLTCSCGFTSLLLYSFDCCAYVFVLCHLAAKRNADLLQPILVPTTWQPKVMQNYSSHLWFPPPGSQK